MFKKKNPGGLRLPSALIRNEDDPFLAQFRGNDLTEKYKIMRDLGSGAFKNSYLVKTKNTSDGKEHEYVLFKFKVSPNSDENKQEITNFRRMMDNVKECSPYVICPVDIGYHNGELALVANFFKGTTLTTYLEKDCASFDMKLEMMIQLMEGLEFLHTKLGFIHFDIKPDNIQVHVSSQGKVEVGILDIGTGCFKDSINKKSCAWRGTLAYAPPEALEEFELHQNMGDIRESATLYNWQKMDIYSMGRVFQEIMTDCQNDKLMKQSVMKRNSLGTPDMPLIQRDKKQRVLKVIKQMMDINYNVRPTSSGVLAYLKRTRGRFHERRGTIR